MILKELSGEHSFLPRAIEVISLILMFGTILSTFAIVKPIFKFSLIELLIVLYDDSIAIG